MYEVVNDVRVFPKLYGYIDYCPTITRFEKSEFVFFECCLLAVMIVVKVIEFATIFLLGNCFSVLFMARLVDL